MKLIEKIYLSKYCSEKPDKFGCHDSSIRNSIEKEKILETIQQQKNAFYEKTKVSKKIIKVFYLWQKRTCKVVQIKEKSSYETDITGN